MATLRPRWFELFVHTTRLAMTVLLLVLVRRWPAFAIAAALLIYLGAFAFNHDVAHGALGLPRRLNEWVMAATALVMGVSGHGMRLMHQRHHARPMAADDIEGVGATLTRFGALLAGPMNAARYRVEAFRAATMRERRLQVLETAATLLLTAFALASRSTIGAAWVVVNVAMQMTTALWASHLPHHPPLWLVAGARRLVWTRSAAVLSFVLHDEHHAHPKLPCRLLADQPQTT